MSWKILITDGLEKVGKDILNERNEAVDKKGIEAAELLQVIPEYNAVIIRGRTKMTREVIEAGKNLKVIGRMGVGVDNIDLEAAKDNGVTVVNCAVATSQAVAELALGMMFALARELPRADATMKAETWAKKEFNGIELMGKTLGIIGYGNIGRVVAQGATALGMKVLAFKRNWEGPFANDNVEHATFEEILRNSDFISLHTPLTAQTKYMLNDAAFAKMKDGGVLEEAALLRALESGKVAGAALDVFEKEPPVAWEAAKHPRVIAVPHIGAQTDEAQLRAAVDISTEVLRALNGEELRWKIV